MGTLELLKEKYGEKIDVTIKSKRRVYINVLYKELVKDIVTYMFRSLSARISTISSIDQRGGIELIYHMNMDSEGCTYSIRVLVKKPELKIDTIADIVEGASWIEREIHEMMGVIFKGHPELTKLLLPDDWPEGSFPYRKRSFDSSHEVEEYDDK